MTQPAKKLTYRQKALNSLRPSQKPTSISRSYHGPLPNTRSTGIQRGPSLVSSRALPRPCNFCGKRHSGLACHTFNPVLGLVPTALPHRPPSPTTPPRPGPSSKQTSTSSSPPSPPPPDFPETTHLYGCPDCKRLSISLIEGILLETTQLCSFHLDQHSDMNDLNDSTSSDCSDDSQISTSLLPLSNSQFLHILDDGPVPTRLSDILRSTRDIIQPLPGTSSQIFGPGKTITSAAGPPIPIPVTSSSPQTLPTQAPTSILFGPSPSLTSLPLLPAGPPVPSPPM